MFSFDVTPPLLSQAGLQQLGVANRLGGLAGQVAAAGAEAVGGAGTGRAKAAIQAATDRWRVSLVVMSSAVGSTGTNLGGAASAYTTTDNSAMPLR